MLLVLLVFLEGCSRLSSSLSSLSESGMVLAVASASEAKAFTGLRQNKLGRVTPSWLKGGICPLFFLQNVYITVFQLNRVNSSTADPNKNAYSVAGLKAQKDCQQPKEASLDKKKKRRFVDLYS